MTAVRVEIGDCWWLAATGTRVAALTTSGVRTVVAADRQEVVVRFTTESSYQVALPPLAMALFRDRAGVLVGGTGPEDTVTGRGDVRPGRSDGEIRSEGGPPRELDPDHTEVYVYPPSTAFLLG